MEILALDQFVATAPWPPLTTPDRRPSPTTTSHPQPPRPIPSDTSATETATPTVTPGSTLTNPITVVVLPLF